MNLVSSRSTGAPSATASWVGHGKHLSDYSLALNRVDRQQTTHQDPAEQTIQMNPSRAGHRAYYDGRPATGRRRRFRAALAERVCGRAMLAKARI